MVLERATPELFPEHQVRNELPPHKRILQNLYRLYHLYDPLPMPAVFDQSFEDIRYWNNQRMDHQVYLAGVIFQRDDLTIDNLSVKYPFFEDNSLSIFVRH
jgi:hypothetical protein